MEKNKKIENEISNLIYWYKKNYKIFKKNKNAFKNRVGIPSVPNKLRYIKLVKKIFN